MLRQFEIDSFFLSMGPKSIYEARRKNASGIRVLLVAVFYRLFVEGFRSYIVLFFVLKYEKVTAFEDQAIVPRQDLEKNNLFQSKNATIEVIYSIDIA